MCSKLVQNPKLYFLPTSSYAHALLQMTARNAINKKNILVTTTIRVWNLHKPGIKCGWFSIWRAYLRRLSATLAGTCLYQTKHLTKNYAESLYCLLVAFTVMLPLADFTQRTFTMCYLQEYCNTAGVFSEVFWQMANIHSLSCAN